MSIYKNKTQYDPGRFRLPVTFYRQVPADNGSGGTTVALLSVLATRALQDRFYEGSALALQAGASLMNGDTVIVIRYRRDFMPEKDMNVVCNGWMYMIESIQEVDVPVNYVKLLCLRKDTDLDFFAQFDTILNAMPPESNPDTIIDNG